MTKPTENLTWTATGNKTDPAAIGTDGYKTTDLVPSKFLNYQLAIITEWQQFVDRAFGQTYYVETTSGDDGNDGTATYPFKTIKHAVDLIEDGGYGRVKLAEIGVYEIDADIDMIGKTVQILRHFTPLAADIKFVSYTDTGENNLYGFNLYRGANLFIQGDDIVVDAPLVVGNDWVADCSCIRVFDSVSSVNVACSTAITFSNTAATGTDLPSLVKADGDTRLLVGTPMVTVYGSVVTNSKGYVLNANSMVCGLSGLVSIDDDDYWVDRAMNQRQKLYSGLNVLGFGAFTINLPSNSTSAYETAGLASDVSNADLKTAIEGLMDSAFVGTYDVNVNITSTRINPGVDDDLDSITIEIVGDAEGKNLPITLYIEGVTANGIFYETQPPKTGYNLITNISGLTN